MSYHCPTCGRVLYNRRLTRCGFCGREVPESLRFTSAEVAAIDKKMAELEEQRLQRERIAAEEAETKRQEAQYPWWFLSGM